MATLGLSVTDVGATLRTSLNGNNDSKYSEDNYEYDIRIGIDNFDRTNADDVSKISFLNRKGELIELKQFVGIFYGLGLLPWNAPTVFHPLTLSQTSWDAHQER